MAKKEKEKTKDKSKRKKGEAAYSESLAPQPLAAAASPASEMRRIAREAAWARMFGKNSAKNPFGE